jgi:hypothetical protein
MWLGNRNASAMSPKKTARDRLTDDLTANLTALAMAEDRSARARTKKTSCRALKTSSNGYGEPSHANVAISHPWLRFD